MGGVYMSAIISMGDNYLDWIKHISARFKQSQIKAAHKVNIEMLKFYFELGHDIYESQGRNHYGASFF